MKETNQLINELEDQILARVKRISGIQMEVDTLKSTVQSLRCIDDEETVPILTVETHNKLDEYPGYPITGNLLDKYHFLEQVSLRVWMRKDMDLLIEEIEGKEQVAITLKNSAQRIHAMLKNKEIINLKYNNSSKFSYYCTRREWIGNDDNGTLYVLPEHLPDSVQFSNLSSEQRNPANITWNGIEK